MKKLSPSQFQNAEYARNVWVIEPEAGVTLENVLDKHFLTHVNKPLRPWDLIEVRGYGGQWFARLVVLYRGGTETKCEVLSFHDFSKKEATVDAAESDYEVKFGGAAKWRVIRTSDKHVVATGLASREAADQWLAEHQNAMTA